MNSLARLALVAALAWSGSAGAADPTRIIIGTGGVTGVYYPVGAALCRQFTRNESRHHIECAVESTLGSVFNVNELRSGGFAFAIAQADVQYAAVQGLGDFTAAGPFDTLRSVFSLHIEPFTLVTRKDSGIASLADLRGKRVNIGNPGSGQRSTMERLMAELGWTDADFAAAAELKSTIQSEALCAGSIDAFVFTVGHPSGSITEAASNCGAILVPVEGREVQALVERSPYYRTTTIPEDMYETNDEPVATFGGYASLLTTADMPDDVVYEMVRAVFDNFAAFIRLHPALATLTEEQMISAGLIAPLHPGAVRYYTEKGWM